MASTTNSQQRGYWHETDVTPHSPHNTPDTLPVVPRPQLMLDPVHRANKAALATALFGHPEEVVRLGRFRVLERLGEGGMGVVYAGHDDELDRRVAIKLLHVELGDDPEARARLRREAQALARLSHPNVVQIFEVGEHRGQRYVAMEYVPGQTLHTWLHAGPPRPWRSVLEVLVAAGRGLAAAHEVGLVHRDFKPGNVILAADGRARVLDFGLARSQGDVPGQGVLSAASAATSPLTSPLTLTGGVLGTPAYMAPEQFHGLRCDARSDQFSFCVALFEALYGLRPFAGTSALELCGAVDREQRVPIPAGSLVPAWLHAVVLRGLARAPEDRWPSMAALLHELTRDRDGQRRRRRLTAGIAALTSVALALAGTFGVSRLREYQHEAQCLAEGAQISAVWNPIVRAQLVAAVAPVDAAAREQLALELDDIDAAASHWRRLRCDACRDPVATTTTLQFMQQRVQRCFDEARDNLRTTIAVMAQSGADDLPFGSIDNRNAERCRDESWLSTEGSAYPDDPAVRSHWQAVRAELGRSELALHEGRPTEARSRARQALVAAQHLGAPSLTLHALRALYTAQLALGERRQALASFASALALSSRVVRGSLAESTDAVGVELLLGAAGGPPHEALAAMLNAPTMRTALPTTHTLAEALANPTRPLWRQTFLSRWWLFGRIFVRNIAATAEAFLGLGDFPAAEEYARNGLIVVTASAHRDDQLELTLLTTLARAAHGLGDLERASVILRRADELARVTHDLSPARRGWVLLAQANLDLDRGRLADAAHSLARAQALLPAADVDDDRFAPALGLAFASLHTLRGEPSQAAARLAQAREQLVASHGITRMLWATGELQRVRLDLDAGRLDDAHTNLSAVRRVHAELVGPDHISQAPVLALQGELERARGQLLASRATLERAHALIANQTVAWHTRAAISDQLARTLAALGEAPERARALALAAAAHDQRSQHAPRTQASPATRAPGEP